MGDLEVFRKGRGVDRVLTGLVCLKMGLELRWYSSHSKKGAPHEISLMFCMTIIPLFPHTGHTKEKEALLVNVILGYSRAEIFFLSSIFVCPL